MSDQPQAQASRPWWALAVAIVAFVAAVWLIGNLENPGPADPGATDGTSAMLAVAPGGTVDLASLPAEHQRMYRAAADDPEGFEAVACYCGCEEFLDHRHLLDCFVRPSGGWERHATGCGVCLAEARDVVELRSARTPTEDIARHIDERYGAITVPTT